MNDSDCSDAKRGWPDASAANIHRGRRRCSTCCQRCGSEGARSLKGRHGQKGTSHGCVAEDEVSSRRTTACTGVRRGMIWEKIFRHGLDTERFFTSVTSQFQAQFRRRTSINSTRGALPSLRAACRCDSGVDGESPFVFQSVSKLFEDASFANHQRRQRRSSPEAASRDTHSAHYPAFRPYQLL